MPRNNVKVISKTLEFDQFHQLEIYTLQHKSLDSDEWLPPYTREVYRSGAAANVLMYHPESDQLLLCEQFRTGAYVAGAENPWLIECAGGIIDPGETPEEAACREGFEESGCPVTDMEFITKFYNSSSCLDETTYLYCGRISGDIKTGIHGMVEEGEEIRTHLLPVSDVIKMLDENKILNVTASLALNWFARKHDEIRKKWLGE